MSFQASSSSTGISFNFTTQANASKPSFGTALNSFSTPTSFGNTSAPSFLSSSSSFASSQQSFGTFFTTPTFSFSSSPSVSQSVQGIGTTSQPVGGPSSSSLFGSSLATSSASGGSLLFSAPSSFSSFASPGSSSSFGTSQLLFSTPSASSGASLFNFAQVGTTASSSANTFSTAFSAPSFQSSSFSFGTGTFTSANSTSLTFGTTSSGSVAASSSAASFSLPITTAASTPIASSGFTGISNTSTSLSAPLFTGANQFSSSTVLGSTSSSAGLGTASTLSFSLSGFSKDSLNNVVGGGGGGGGGSSGTTGVVGSSSSFSLTSGSTQATISATRGSNVTTSTPSSSEPISEVKDLHLNEIINSWNDKVEELVDRFRRQAAVVNRWDRFLYQNERRIETLYTEAQGIHSAHKELEMNLDTALAQQKELDGYLAALENQLEKYFVSVGDMGSTFADYEREEMYRTATKMASELDTIGTSLREVVADIHQMNKPAEDDVVGQIVAILDAHLKSLEYLDETCSQLGKRTQELSLLSDRVEKDTHRLLHSPNLRR